MNKSVNLNSNKLVVKSSTANLITIRKFINSKASSFGFTENEIEDIVISVDEACTNIIEHSYNSKPNFDLEISIILSKNKFIIKIVDYGESFEPDTLKDMDIELYHKQRRVGGLGVYLMKTLMDEVKYKSVKNKYNQVMLTKILTN
ncbi:MAG: ATP-binding protein [Ignavibacteriales bacterium CG_4_9_14_3_um_filter_30_11]|nr:MAG: ATP-binding protein [Ignavibacteriales bacterium CG_4_9_14_3_um_filter_30_11]